MPRCLHAPGLQYVACTRAAPCARLHLLQVVVVCTLYGVQVALENPFDGEGMVR